jgi:hypothetical protein
MESRFAAIFAALYVAHQIADYWVQTDWQARTKAQPGTTGHLACALHVTTYTATLAIILAWVAYRIDVDLSFARVFMALSASAVTHYIADRRTPLRRLAIASHHSKAWLDSGGLALVDQAWHMGWLGIAALIIA